MRNYLALTRVLMKNGQGLGLSSDMSKKRKPLTTAILYIVLAVCMVPFIVMTFTGSLTLTRAMALAGDTRVMLNVILLMECLMTLIFGITYVLSMFYLSNDLEKLLPLPLTPETILLSKLTVVYVYEMLMTCLLIFPAFLGHGIGAGWSVVQWILGILVFLTAPVVPIICAGLLSLLLMFALRRVASRSLITGISTVLLLAFVMVISSAGSFMGTSAAIDDVGSAEAVAEMGDGLLAKYGFLFPTLRFASAAVREKDLVSFLILLALSAAAVLIFLAVGRVLYMKTVLDLKDVSAGRRAMTQGEQEKAFRAQGQLSACFGKEWKLLMRSPIFFLNTALLCFIWPVFFILPAVLGSSFGGDEGAGLFGELFETIRMPEVMRAENTVPIALLIVCAVTVFAASMSFVSGTAVSREGQGIFRMKAMPVPYKTQLTAKFLVGLLITAVSSTGYLLIPLVLLVVIGYPPAVLVFGVIWSLLFNVILNCIDLFVDAAFPKLNWQDEQAAVKQNFMPVLEMLICLVLGGGICFLYALFTLILGFAWLPATLIMTVVLAAAAAGVYFGTMAFGARRLAALE